MITQLVMDAVAFMLVNLLNLWPAAPEANAWVGSIVTGLNVIADTISAFQPIIPFEILLGLGATFAVLLAHTAVMLGLRITLWVWNR